MNIYIGSDHAGFELKEYIINNYKRNNINIINMGYYNNVKSVDYPDIAKIVCEKIIEDENNNIKSNGILICGTGIGISIAANKFKNIRCALIHDMITSEFSKKHNNANIIALGEKIVNKKNIKDILDKFFESEFEGGRHINRLNKLKN